MYYYVFVLINNNNAWTRGDVDCNVEKDSGNLLTWLDSKLADEAFGFTLRESSLLPPLTEALLNIFTSTIDRTGQNSQRVHMVLALLYFVIFEQSDYLRPSQSRGSGCLFCIGKARISYNLGAIPVMKCEFHFGSTVTR